MKKTVAIFVALLLLFNTVGMLVFYWGEMEKCENLALKEIANENFNEETLIHFSSGNTNFQLIDDKEILYEGILYDIVKKETKNGETFYSCFDDKKESGFWNGIAQLAKSNSERSSSPTKDNAPEVLKYIGVEKNIENPNLYLQTSTFLGFSNNTNFYQNPDVEIVAPPPKV